LIGSLDGLRTGAAKFSSTKHPQLFCARRGVVGHSWSAKVGHFWRVPKHFATHFENTRHRPTNSAAIICVSCHCGNIMGQKNTALFPGPFQESDVAGARKACVLCPHNIKIGLSPQETPNDIIVRFFVRGERQHSWC
jgi:hypothetical protein